MNHAERYEHCKKHFWMRGQRDVVVKCRECCRHTEMAYAYVIASNGKLTYSKCGSCNTTTCAPVLKDHKTVAEVL